MSGFRSVRQFEAKRYFIPYRLTFDTWNVAERFYHAQLLPVNGIWKPTTILVNVLPLCNDVSCTQDFHLLNRKYESGVIRSLRLNFHMSVSQVIQICSGMIGTINALFLLVEFNCPAYYFISRSISRFYLSQSSMKRQICLTKSIFPSFDCLWA